MARSELIFDQAAVLDRVDGDKSLILELNDLLKMEFPKAITKIGEALSLNSPQELAAAAHCIKGALGNLGAMRCFAVARALELLGKSGTIAGADALKEELESEFLTFQNHFKQEVG